jgi:hypothetical protein
MKNTSLQTLHNLSCVNKCLRLSVLQELEDQEGLYPRLIDQTARMKGTLIIKKHFYMEKSRGLYTFYTMFTNHLLEETYRKLRENV